MPNVLNTEQNQSLKNNQRPALFNNQSIVFLEGAITIIENLRLTSDEMKSTIDDEKKLRSSAFDYRFLLYLNSLVNRIKSGNLTTGAFADALQQNIEKFKTSDPELGKAIEIEFAGIRQNIEGPQRDTILRSLTAGLSEPEKLAGRIDVLKDYAERKLENGNLKSQIVNRLTLIERYLGEINSLNYCLPDANAWNMHVHDDITFFTTRLEGYFKGGIFKDQNGNPIPGIDHFRDEELKKIVFESREIKILYAISQMTHRIEEQRAFLLGLISFLEQDLKEGEWVKVSATKQFVAQLDKHAERFSIEYRNKNYSNSLISNKKKLGQLTLQWIALLKSMEQGLQNLMARKNSVINNSIVFLAGDQLRNTIGIFERRIQDLRDMIMRLTTQINGLILSQSGEINLIKKIEDGITRLERTVRRRWKSRKKRFKYMYEQVDEKLMLTTPIIERFQDVIDIDREDSEIVRQSKRIDEVTENHDSILNSFGNPTGKPSSESLPAALKISFDLARLSEFHEVFDEALYAMKEKDDILRNYDMSQIKMQVLRLINEYLSLVNWARARIQIQTDIILQSASSFMRQYYG